MEKDFTELFELMDFEFAYNGGDVKLGLREGVSPLDSVVFVIESLEKKGYNVQVTHMGDRKYQLYYTRGKNA